MKRLLLSSIRLIQESRKISFPETSRQFHRAVGGSGTSSRLTKKESTISIPILMLGTNDDIASLLDKVNQRHLARPELQTASRRNLSIIQAQSQMYCPSVIDLNLPKDKPNKEVTTARKPQKSLRKKQ